MSYTHLGPMSAFTIDPDTGAEVRYGQVVIETEVDGLTYGIALNCDPKLADNPEAYPELIEALWRLGERGVDDLVEKQQRGEVPIMMDNDGHLES